MAYVLWLFVTLCPLLAHSQSGDDGDAETIDPVCSPMISTKNINLTCEVDEDDIDSIQRVKLCLNGCTNGILGNNSFSFADLPFILGDYELKMYLKGGDVKTKKINLWKMGYVEIVDISCSSMISTKKNNLTCEVDEDDIDSIQHVKLCSNGCTNGIWGKHSFRFADLPSILEEYELQMYLKGGGVKAKKIKLWEMVKIPTPTVHNVTLESDMVIVHIKYQHDFVTEPTFQVEVWRAEDGATDRPSVTVDYQPVTIGAQVLKGNGVYHVHVRGNPDNSFFNGSWTAWSPEKKFEVSLLQEGSNPEDRPYVTYIIICTSVVLVIGLLMLMFLRWRDKIQAYISPNIPNPKATLAHIHREKERPPVSFSPEIFNDISINRVDYAEEKQLDPELEEEGQDDTTDSCQTEEEDDGEDSSTRVEEEKSHLKIKLLAQPEEGENELGRTSVASVRRDCRDETYVTMSSLYRTE